MELSDLGATIRSTRLASGLSQAQLARMAGISRATLNYTEQGRSAVGADALLRILAPLGLGISLATPPKGRVTVSAVDLLAASASVSFTKSIPASDVEEALVTGVFDARWLAHIAVIIDEASDEMLLRALRETSEKTSVAPATIWRNLRSIAHEISSPHPRWA